MKQERSDRDEWSACQRCRLGDFAFRRRHWESFATEKELLMHLRQQFPDSESNEAWIKTEIGNFRFRRVWKELEAERGACQRQPADLTKLFENELKERRGA